MKDAFLILHFLGLAMGVGTGFVHLFIGLASKKWSDEETLTIYSKILRPIGIMGHTGLGVLIITGLGMLHPYMKALKGMPLLHVKFTLVAVLLVLTIIMTKLGKKMVKEQDIKYLAKIKKLGSITHLVGIAIVVCAVLSFN